MRLKCPIIHFSFQNSCSARILPCFSSRLQTSIASFAITQLYNKIYCNLLAEAACEIILDIPIIDWISGDSVRFFNAPDIRQLNIGIIVCNYGEFPLINNRNRYHQIICLRNPDDTIYVCGLASRVTLNIYQSDDLLSFKSRKPKTYFYGFHALTSIKDINLSKVTNNAKSNTN